MQGFSKSIFFCLIFGALSLFGQQYPVKNYTIDEGLPSPNIMDVDQDPSGRMWFASRAGIISYDGFSWTHHKKLFLDHARFVSADRGNVIWAASSHLRYGIAYFSDESWHILNPDASMPDYILTDLVLSEKNGHTEIYLATSVGVVVHYNGREWKRYDNRHGLPAAHIYKMKMAGNALYVLAKNGIYHLNGDRFEKIDISFDNMHRVLGFTFGLRGQLIAVGRGWIAVQKGNTFEYKAFERVYNIYEFSNIFLDDRNRLYIPTAFRLLQYDLDSGDIMELGRRNGLLMDVPSSVFQDREKNLWMIASVGISKISSRRFITLNKNSGLLNDEVSAIVEYKPGHFVLGHNTGYTFYDGENFTRVAVTEETGSLEHGVSRIWDLARQNDGTIWSASIFHGISRIKGNATTWYFKQDRPGHVSVCVDAKDRVWAMIKRGIYMFTGDTFKLFFTIPEGIGNARKIFAGTDGSLFLASDISGIIHIKKDKTYKVYRVTGNSFRNNTYALYAEENGNLLVGTAAGLSRVEGDSLAAARGFPPIDYPVYSIIRDDRENFWIGTDRGVVFWDGEKSRRFTHDDGLAGNEMNRSAALQDSKGRIWLGSDFGITIYDYNYDRSDIPAPVVEIGSVVHNDGEIAPAGTQKLHSPGNTIDINFAVISFRDENEIEAQYMLEGFDAQWVTQKPLRISEARYNRLPPGEYIFKLRARSPESAWSSIVQSSPIVITVPFYKRLWFALLVTALMVTMVFVSYLAVNRQKQARMLEEEVQRRTDELKLSEEKFRDFFRHSHDLLFFADASGIINEINAAGASLLDKENPAQVAGIPLDAFFEADPQWADTRSRLLETSSVRDVTLNLQTRSGLRIVLFSADLVFDKKGDVSGWRGTIKDITDRQKMHEQNSYLAKMETISQMAGGIAHDFNNLLGAILGYASLLKLKKSKQDADYGALETIEQSAQRGSLLTKQMLAFARRTRTVRTDFDLRARIEKSIAEFTADIKKNISVTFSCPDGVLPVLADAGQLDQILQQVLQNAADAIEHEGRIEVDCGFRQLTRKEIPEAHGLEEGTYVFISVRDNGRGISEEIRDKIFEPFYTTKERARGSGLGLSVVHGYLNSNKAFARVDSVPGEGTTFSLFFPAGKLQEQPDKRSNKPRQTVEAKGTVLVIDDESSMREMIKDALQMKDYTVDGASGGEEGLALIQSGKKYKLIILDMIMPGMGGDEVLLHLREMDFCGKVLVISGFSNKTHFERGASIKPDGFLEKPFTVEQLQEKAGRLLTSA